MLYVFGKWPVNVQSCMERFQQMFPHPEVKVLVFCDVMYSHCMGEKLIEISFFFNIEGCLFSQTSDIWSSIFIVLQFS